MKIKKWQVYKKLFLKKYMMSYNLGIVILAMALVTLHNTNLDNQSKKNIRGIASAENPSGKFLKNDSKKSKPKFFDRLPNTYKKAKRSLQIDITYEKLADRKMIRLIGTIDSAHVPSDVIQYKWHLAKNLKKKNGNLSGSVNITNTNEITLDAEIVDMEKPIRVRLEAYVFVDGVKVGNIQSFSINPTLMAAEEIGTRSISSKTEGYEPEEMSKEEYTERQIELKEQKQLGFKFQQ